MNDDNLYDSRKAFNSLNEISQLMTDLTDELLSIEDPVIRETCLPALDLSSTYLAYVRKNLKTYEVK
jgi:hypothetical protein